MKKILLFFFIPLIVFSLLSCTVRKDFSFFRKKNQTKNSNLKRYIKIKLDAIPTETERKDLEAQGIYLVEYVSGTTYYALIDEQVVDSLLIRDGEKNFEFRREKAKSKLDLFLSSGNIPEYALVKEGVVRVIVAYFPEIEDSEIGAYIKKQRLQNVLPLDDFKMFYADVPLCLIIDLAEQPWVRRIECIPPPEELFSIEKNDDLI